jgi:hypothetical protein
MGSFSVIFHALLILALAVRSLRLGCLTWWLIVNTSAITTVITTQSTGCGTRTAGPYHGKAMQRL